MRQHCGDYYIQIFNRLREDREFDDSLLHHKVLRYCFGPLIQYDLHMTRILWNRHEIRRQNGRGNFCDRPNVLYNIPEKYGCFDGKIEVDISLIDRLLSSEFAIEPVLIEPETKELVELLIPNAVIPTNTEEALKLYRKILLMVKERRHVV